MQDLLAFLCCLSKRKMELFKFIPWNFLIHSAKLLRGNPWFWFRSRYCCSAVVSSLFHASTKSRRHENLITQIRNRLERERESRVWRDERVDGEAAEWGMENLRNKRQKKTLKKQPKTRNFSLFVDPPPPMIYHSNVSIYLAKAWQLLLA